MNAPKHDPNDIREAFNFLVSEFGYSVTRDEVMLHDDRPYGFVIEYIGNERRVHLSYDYKENFFDFRVIRGLKTRYPNDYDNENIVIFLRRFCAFDPTIELKTIEPNHQTAAEAATVNARLLKKYAARISKVRNDLRDHLIATIT